MNYLSTKAERLSTTNKVRVYWATGKKPGAFGYIDVDVCDTCAQNDKEKLIVGEVEAIYHLIYQLNAISNVSSGKNVILNVSSGQTKKLLLMRHSSKHLLKHAYFVQFRLEGLSVNVCTSPYLIRDDFELTGTIKARNIFSQEIEIESLGRVEITYHAYQRFIERCRSMGIESKCCWKSLNKQLRNPLLHQAVLPKNVTAHKLRKYGDKPEIWTHTSGTIQFVMLKELDRRILVTVTNRFTKFDRPLKS